MVEIVVGQEERVGARVGRFAVLEEDGFSLGGGGGVVHRDLGVVEEPGGGHEGA